jgi:hypothetical protein
MLEEANGELQNLRVLAAVIEREQRRDGKDILFLLCFAVSVRV